MQIQGNLEGESSNLSPQVTQGFFPYTPSFVILSGGDGGWNECVWSETLGQCFSPSFLPIICLAGRCGRVIRGSSSGCMGSCVNNQQCSTCMSSYHCGWCGKEGISGEGRCLEGGLHGQYIKTDQSCPA